MKPFLDYFTTFLHLLGMLIFVGGHIWFGLLSAIAERYQSVDSGRTLAWYLPILSNGFGAGVLLLFVSGTVKLILWGEPGMIFLPDLYGWIMLVKLVLYIMIVGNGMMIERRYLPVILDTGSGWLIAWGQVKLRARLNLVLILIVVVLGETLRYSRL